ncbi:TonB-dependent receptor domain-containing protein [Tenacibaculum sp. Ill]|uniref:TonB-dependent receptor domain-containing protein n=1 Tax=Tenacibaculum sp. Ill TaxID=3445935 RepID=UPI003F7AF989
MKKIIPVSLVLFLFITTTLVAQNNSIKGIIVTDNNDFLTSVNITLSPTNKGLTSNEKGEFKFENLKKGKYVVNLSMVGFEKKSITVRLKDNESKNLGKIVLKEAIDQLDEVTINGVKNKYSKNKVSNSLRLKTPIKQLPQNVQVVGFEILQDQLVTNMLEGAFRNVSGVSNIEHWGHFARVNMRGFRLPAFRNGVNIQDSWGPLSEDTYMVDRIEFVKGPSGFMMAAGEPGGFYNVVTKKPTEERIGSVNLMAGSFDTYRAAADFGGALTSDKRLLARLNILYQNTGSHRKFEDTERIGIAPSLSYKITDKTNFLTEFSFQKLNTLVGAAYIFGPVDKGFGSLPKDFTMIDSNFPDTDIKEVSLLNQITHNFNENWSVEAKYVTMLYTQEGASAWLGSIQNNGDAIRSISIWDAISESEYFQLYANGKFNTGSVSHKIMGGFDYTDKEYFADFSQAGAVDTPANPFNIYNPTYGDRVFPVFDRSTPLKERASLYTYGTKINSLYAQDELSFLENKIRLTLAGRYTQLTPKGDITTKKFTPRIGLSADITPQITAYGLYDQSFLANDAIDNTGKRFDPIEGTIYEAGLKTNWLNGKINASLSAYIINKNNMTTSDPTDPTRQFSILLGEVESKGFEFDMQAHITSELDLLLNYANTNVEIAKSDIPNTVGTRIAGHAKHITNGWLNYNFNKNSALKGFGLSLGYQYLVDRSSWTWNANNNTELPDYFRMDGGVHWKNNKLRVALNINNILNKHLYSGANYGTYLYWQSESGINGRVSLTYNLF